MIELNHGDYSEIIKALNILSENLAKKASVVSSYEGISPIAKLQQSMDDGLKGFKSLAVEENISDENTIELLHVQEIIQKFEGEISKIKFRFSVDGEHSANTIA